MKPLLVLAGNQKEYLNWARDNRERVELEGMAPRYLPAYSLNHLGYKDCLYTEIGSFYRSSRNDELYKFFARNNITKI